MNKSEIYKDQQNLLKSVHDELEAGLKIIEENPKTITFFGSARLREGTVYYEMARELSKRIAKETGYVLLSGGGPGIMEASARGATEGGGNPIGINISLPHEQHKNQYINKEIVCKHFFTRKTIMTFSAEAWIFFPGGYGTFDELFSILTLVQTGKIPRMPIILVGSEYWNELDSLIKKVMLEKYHTISENDTSLYTIIDDEEQILSIIKNTLVQEWWKDYEGDNLAK